MNSEEVAGVNQVPKIAGAYRTHYLLFFEYFDEEHKDMRLNVLESALAIPDVKARHFGYLLRGDRLLDIVLERYGDCMVLLR